MYGHTLVSDCGKPSRFATQAFVACSQYCMVSQTVMKKKKETRQRDSFLWLAVLFVSLV